MRLFAAVRPPTDVLDHLEGALVSVRGGPAMLAHAGRVGLRWTPPEDRHITVAFYGEVPEGYLDETRAALDVLAATAGPFDASLAGAGLFDGRALWVGCTGDGWLPLMAAAGRLGEEVLGRAADGRRRPHLTVARSRAGERRGDRRRDRRGDRSSPAGDQDPAALAHALALYRGPAWTVREVVLVASQLGAGPGGGPRHDVVHVADLRAVAG